MTSATSRTVANVVLASAGLAAAYVILTTPPLRRQKKKLKHENKS